MSSLRTAMIAASLLIVLMVAAGCGGGGGGGAGPPQPLGPVTIQGVVVAADNPARTLSQVTITAQPSGRATTTDASGVFLLTGVSAGVVTLDVVPLHNSEYRPTEIVFPSGQSTTLRFTITLLPLIAPLPESLVLQPLDSEVEINGRVQFEARIVTAQGPADYAPTWIAVGLAGSISPQGLFTALAPGVSEIYAFSGTLSAHTTLRVLTVRGPLIREVIALPNVLGASGGAVAFTAAASDGQGVASAVAQVRFPTGGDTLVPLSLVAGDALNGTYRALFTAPVNNNPLDASGHQEPQVYRMRVHMVDTGGRPTDSEYVEFQVNGVDAAPLPPEPPSLSDPVIGVVTASPNVLGASGGLVAFTATGSDEQGVASAQAEVVLPTGGATIVPLSLVAGDALSGTYSAQFTAPVNNNPLDASGVQNPQVYLIRTHMVDTGGHATDSAYVQFQVNGVDAAPSPPSL